MRARFEALIGLGAPFFDLILTVGERVSHLAGRNDEYVPVRSAGERLDLEPRRPRSLSAPGERPR